MLLLASTSDLFRVTTTLAATGLDAHCSWVDVTTGGVYTPGRTNTATITTATTTTLVASPAGSTFRTIKTVCMRNRHASSSNDLTVIHTDGTNALELLKVTLAAGEALHYDEHNGWTVRDTLGRIKYREDSLVPTASPAYTTVILSADQTNNNAVANTIQDCTGLSFSVTAGSTYWFRFCVMYTAAATTTGSRWTVNGPATTLLSYKSTYSLSTTSATLNEGVAAYDSPAASSASSAATAANIAVVEGFVKPSANGTLILRFASEVSASAIVAKAGSICHWQQVL